MIKKIKISRFEAIVISLNAILGAGLFINTLTLSKKMGIWSYLPYAAAFIILLPIVISFASLAEESPVAGGIYKYSEKYLSPKIGFISAWFYFLGKLTSATLLCHIISVFLKKQIPFFQNIPILLLDIFIIFTFLLFNVSGMHANNKIQLFFLAAKIIPFLLILFSIFIPTSIQTLPFTKFNTYLFFESIPISIYALMSFELICSIGNQITSQNIRKSITLSFFLAAFIATIFQISAIKIFGTKLLTIEEPLYLFKYFPFFKNEYFPKIMTFLLLGSFAGGIFSSFSTNSWNLFRLAKENYVPLANYFVKTTNKGIPWVSSLFQGILGILLLQIATQIVPLQNMAVFGIVFSYFLTMLAATQKQNSFNISPKIFFIGALSSIFILFITFVKLYHSGISLPFSALFLTGIFIGLIKKQNNKKN